MSLTLRLFCYDYPAQLRISLVSLQWLDFVLSQDAADLPQVFSTSYGDDEQTVPESYAKRVCAGMAQLGARGVTLFFSSGDGGVGDGSSDPTSHECYTNDGKEEVKFIPSFPAAVSITAFYPPNNA
jgi:tripeptidyl-peptidase I